MLAAIGFGTPPTKGVQGVYDSIHNACVGNLILSAGGLIPGYWTSFLLIDSWGRKPIQLMGFTMLTILFVVMGMFHQMFHFFFHFLTMNSQDSVMTSLPPHQRLPKDSSFFTASPIISKTLAPTLPPSLFLEKSSPLVTVPPHTVSQLPLASSVPSSPKLAFPNW